MADGLFDRLRDLDNVVSNFHWLLQSEMKMICSKRILKIANLL